MARWLLYDDKGYPIVYDDLNLPPGNPVIQPSGLNFNFPAGGDYTNPTSLNQNANALQELATLHNTVLADNSAIATGTGGNPVDAYAKQHPTFIVRRPWLDMPDGAYGFDPQQVDALGVVGTEVFGASVTVPEGYDGVINGFNWNFVASTVVLFAQGSGDLKIQILRNGAAIRNYDNILMEKGCILSPRPINPLRIYSGQTIQIVIFHLANVLLFGDCM